MSKVCFQCDKKFMSGNNVSHSKRRTKRHFKPNLATKVLTINGTKKKVNICVHCLKSLHIK